MQIPARPAPVPDLPEDLEGGLINFTVGKHSSLILFFKSELTVANNYYK